MREFELPHADVLVHGQVIEVFLAAFGAYQERGKALICRHLGIDDLSGAATAFYPAQLYLQALREMQEQFGSALLTKMGRKIMDTMPFPPGIDSVETVMASVNASFQMNHKNAEGKLGAYHWTLESPNHGTMVSDHPYPCAWDMGVLIGCATRFAPHATVTHDDTKPCRHEGAETCTYRVEW
jgi:hypothetical protein